MLHCTTGNGDHVHIPLLGPPSRLFDIFGSAIAAAGAADVNRHPRARDLRRLGIDPDQYRTIPPLRRPGDRARSCRATTSFDILALGRR